MGESIIKTVSVHMIKRKKVFFSDETKRNYLVNILNIIYVKNKTLNTLNIVAAVPYYMGVGGGSEVEGNPRKKTC